MVDIDTKEIDGENVKVQKKKKFTVDMTEAALRDFVYRSYYSRFSGIASLLLGVFGVFAFIYSLPKQNIRMLVCYLLVAVICLVATPVELYFKAKKQVKTSPSYKSPIDYEIELAGLTITQGENSTFIEWKKIYRLLYTNKMFAIYTNPYNAFVLPNSELGNDKSIIITRIVQYTQPYQPRMSGNLREFISNGNN